MSAAFVLLIQSIILACAFVGRAFLAVSVFITRAPRTTSGHGGVEAV